MKLTIKANEKITAAIIDKYRNAAGEYRGTKCTKINGDIYMIEFDFMPSYLWSDLEFWLEDENGNICDYAKMNVSKRNKMQFHK